jgi:hypothetical protein
MPIATCVRRAVRPATLALLALAAACSESGPPPLAPEPEPTGAHDQALLREAASAAWAYVEREYQPTTGLINSVAEYPYATVWDIASGLAALHSAHRLELLPPAEYDHRMARALRTLQTLRLFDGTAFHKNYSTRSGAAMDLAGRETERGVGWSALDIGRLLVWLRIIATDQPQHAAAAQRVVERVDFAGILRDGYLWGAHLEPDGELRRYVEGRIGYEQYAAAGFALWGYRADQALRLHQNSLPIEVLGVPLVADRRGHDHLTSEPFILAGLEMGWDPEMRELAGRVLQVQQERHRRSRQVTVVSEDHVPVAPYYFYYYDINYHGSQFAVRAQSTEQVLDEPRWISAKAAYAWYALLPGEYTRLAVASVAAARHPVRGWSSGVYEGKGGSTGSENINTAAVILQSVLYTRQGRPLLGEG